MNRILLTTLLVLTGAGTAWAQFPLVPISQIQERSQADLAACEDESPLLGDTVRIRGVVLMDGDKAQSQPGIADGWLWVQDGNGPFSGINVRANEGATSESLYDLLAGDSVEITGIVDNFGSETQFVPLPAEFGTSVVLLGENAATEAISITCVQLNDANQVNSLPTGEQWEGQYVELTGLTVTSVGFFSGGTRVSFVVTDASGGAVNISDRFIAGRLPSFEDENNPGEFGTLLVPNVGDMFDTIRGVVSHSANGCTGANGRGYEVLPFDPTDYVSGIAAPSIQNIARDLIAPSSSQTVTISADITDQDDAVASATLFYGIGAEGEYVEVAMTAEAGSSVYEATIPAQPNGTLIKYYLSAEDEAGNVSSNPTVSVGRDPLFYYVNDDGLTIVDIQRTPFAGGASGYNDLEVTVEGTVTASAQPGDLGFVYIQQADETQWAGLTLSAFNSVDLSGLERGDIVRVTGTVGENFGLTRLESINNLQEIGTGTIEPLELDADFFSDADSLDIEFEPYESMLIKLVNADEEEDSIYVVNLNADDPNNFAEYRVGTDVFAPDQGLRVLAGRRTGSAFASLNFSYINDSTWIENSGILEVDPIVLLYTDNMTGLTGLLTYSFGNFKLLPRNNDDMENFGRITSLREDVLTAELAIYPNPASTQLTVRAEANESLRVSLTDLTGRVLLSQPVAGETSVDVSRIAAGFYLATVTDAQGRPVAVSRVVIAR